MLKDQHVDVGKAIPSHSSKLPFLLILLNQVLVNPNWYTHIRIHHSSKNGSAKSPTLWCFCFFFASSFFLFYSFTPCSLICKQNCLVIGIRHNRIKHTQQVLLIAWDKRITYSFIRLFAFNSVSNSNIVLEWDINQTKSIIEPSF